ncbi:MAG: hypothetical protein AAGM67_01430, partial [Bacteroidota bacterium]
MALVGQASGDFLESSSALRIMYAGVQNSIGVLTEDAFTQTNPPIVATGVSQKLGANQAGVLSGSIAFTRPDVGPNRIGGNVEGLAVAAQETLIRAVGVFINTAVGNAFENAPGQASGKGPYMSGQGTYGNQLFETQVLDGASVAGFNTNDPITYTTGVELIASRNGYLQAADVIDGGGALVSFRVAEISADIEHGRTAADVIGILKMPADSNSQELIYDQR